jgi:alpha-tubulin suppressor-like RCC1 family protein
MADGTLTPSSVQLLRGATPVAGTISLLQGSGVAAAFTPVAALDPNTAYRLVVTGSVQDLDGDALAGSVTVDFTTGTSSLGSPVTITMLPDSMLRIPVGSTYQATVAVRDGNGNLLLGEPVSWSTSDPNVVTVSGTGLLTAIGDGTSILTASAGGLNARLYVLISANPPASVQVAPTPATVAVGDTIHLTATVRDADGRVINHPSLTWTSSDEGRAIVSPSDPDPRIAVVSGLTGGSVTITATSGTASGTVVVTVGPPLPVASVTVAPNPSTVLVRARLQLTATLRDANDHVLVDRVITWSSDNESVATVDADGLVTGVTVGSATITATSEGVSGTAGLSVEALSFSALSTGGRHTCALDAGTAYCWGFNNFGQLGDATTDPRLFPAPVVGGLSFASVSAGIRHTCGLTATGAAYCWGWNDWGQLGDGSTTDRHAPVAVLGGIAFASLSAGTAHTCGVTTTGTPYCWGFNLYGGLGDGTTAQRSSPVPVAGGLTFVTISAGGGYTCGVRSTGAAYCWGHNEQGQLGDGSTTNRSTPVPVSGSLSFAALTARDVHTCGVTPEGTAYCWGSNSWGTLGDGSGLSSAVPVSVAGGLAFRALAAGGIQALDYTCGVTTAGAGYCWGYNADGQLGDGSTTIRTTPVAVLGGLTFLGLSAGDFHTCGITTDGAYCWGSNFSGALGDGTTTDRSVPVKVVGQP